MSSRKWRQGVELSEVQISKNGTDDIRTIRVPKISHYNAIKIWFPAIAKEWNIRISLISGLKINKEGCPYIWYTD
jgi:hypothetical protein